MSELLAASDAVPAWWRDKSAAAGFIALRSRLSFTQDELAAKSGVVQARISHLEGGGDALLSTWRRVYAAMGRGPGHWLIQRSRPRPHGLTARGSQGK